MQNISIRNQKLLSTLTFLMISLLFTIPVKAETEKIENPAWVKVPGTEPSTQDIERGFDEPAFLNTNGIIKKGGNYNLFIQFVIL